MSNSVGTAIGPCETMLFRQIHPLLIKGGVRAEAHSFRGANMRSR